MHDTPQLLHFLHEINHAITRLPLTGAEREHVFFSRLNFFVDSTHPV